MNSKLFTLPDMKDVLSISAIYSCLAEVDEITQVFFRQKIGIVMHKYLQFTKIVIGNAIVK